MKSNYSHVIGLILLPLLFLCACSTNDSAPASIGEPPPVLSSKLEAPLNILVIGGTSGIGLETAKLAAQRGHAVTAVARRPERMTFTHANLATVAGDILDAQNMLALTAEQDAVVIAIGMGPTRDPVTLFSKGAENVLAAMQANQLRRLITITGIGAGETRGHGGFFYDRILFPLALKTIYEDKDRQEALIRKHGEGGGVDWTIVRPGFLNDEPANGQYRVVHDIAGITAGDITRADVAHFTLYAIESGAYLKQSPLISEN